MVDLALIVIVVLVVALAYVATQLSGARRYEAMYRRQELERLEQTQLAREKHDAAKRERIDRWYQDRGIPRSW